MSSHSPEPSLENYPGWFPAAKPPFWSRTKVAALMGVVGLLVGLLVGLAAGGDADGADSGDHESVAAPPAASPADTEAAVDQAVDQTARAWRARMAALRTREDHRLALARREARRRQQQAVRKAVAAERAKAAQALAQAKARAAASSSSAASSSTASTGRGGRVDPRFSYCYQANAAGYGPYWRGRDAEYYWYEDADNDGEVCE